jgi:hypothetical protein
VSGIDVFSIHDVLISQIVLFFNDMEDKSNMSADASLRAQYSNIPVFSPPGGGDERSELSSKVAEFLDRRHKICKYKKIFYLN